MTIISSNTLVFSDGSEGFVEKPLEAQVQRGHQGASRGCYSRERGQGNSMGTEKVRPAAAPP